MNQRVSNGDGQIRDPVGAVRPSMTGLPLTLWGKEPRMFKVILLFEPALKTAAGRAVRDTDPSTVTAKKSMVLPSNFSREF